MKRVITYGTFDLFHEGHYNILRRAKELGDYLIVAVTGESYDIERGKLNVVDNLVTRIENVKNTGFADMIIVEEYMGQKIHDISKYKVDTLVVGSDWIGKFDYLNKYCEVKYLERTKDISSTQLRESNTKIYKVGIITDDTDDNEILTESTFVSGLHINSVYSSVPETAKVFAEKYSLNGYTSLSDGFWDGADIVYVKSGLTQRYAHIKAALSHDKHVIFDFPPTLDDAELKDIYAEAESRKLIIAENIILAYMRSFRQLLWFINGGIIGDPVRIESSLSYAGAKASQVALAVFALEKLLASADGEFSLSSVNSGEVSFDTIYAKFDKTIATSDISTASWTNNHMSIVGTEGSIDIPGKWWAMDYFEIYARSNDKLNRYSFNIDGNGFRYLLHELLTMLNAKSYRESTHFTHAEAIRVAAVVRNLLNQ
jgi:glycerol-3-phosphate cytidylyltransferase